MENSATEWFLRRSTYTAWSTESAERVLLQSHSAPFSPQRILQTLIVLQAFFGYIPQQAQEWLVRKTGTHIADIRSLLSFYSFLVDTPPPAFHLRFANNIIEQHAGLDELYERVQAELCGTDCIIETTSCIGLSDHPLPVLVNGFPVTRLDMNNVHDFCNLIRSKTPLECWPESWFGINNVVRHSGPLTRYQYIPGLGIKNAQGLTREQIIQQVGDAGLRGLGGAGFPTAFKWHWCEQQPEPIKYIVCNADEGEPGTFKDRFYLTKQMDRVIEGMAIAARAVGARKGYIYLRGEYLYLYQAIQQELQHAKQIGILNDLFEIELHLGAGAYICGEESALIESLQGKRGIPTSKPPYPGEKGLFGKPTVVNNVETFASVTYIFQEGSSAFHSMGTEKSKGSRLHSVSGDCEQPGLYELPQGTPLSKLLSLCGAKATQCVQVGGPSGQLLFPDQFDTTLDFEGPGHGGAIMVFDTSRSVMSITQNFSNFFRHESCGFCTPCRAGTVALTHLLERYTKLPENRQQTSKDLLELTELMNKSSHCGLGKTAGQPVASMLRWANDHDR